MPVDFLAGETHYLDHLYPIWKALPGEERGSILLAKVSPSSDWGSRLREHAIACGYEGCLAFSDSAHPRDAAAWLAGREGLVVTASVNDARLAEKSRRPQVFCEHGAGQTYSSRHPSYAGGHSGRSQVRLFLCPNESVAARNRQYYPGAESVVVGCPKLDAWHRAPRKQRSDPPVVAISFHWDAASVCPEARWAYPHYRNHLLPVIRDERWRVVGHGHPRALSALQNAYRRWGLPVLEHFSDVVQQADVYVCDNSSTLYEFASLNRPVVVLNAPWYRRGVEHGLRFWEAANVGVQVDDPHDLSEAIALALRDAPAQRRARKAAVALAYAYTDGRAAERAAEAILACSQSRLTRATSSMCLTPRSDTLRTSRARPAPSCGVC